MRKRRVLKLHTFVHLLRCTADVMDAHNGCEVEEERKRRVLCCCCTHTREECNVGRAHPLLLSVLCTMCQLLCATILL